jgi:hypothetical protein
MSNNCNIDRRNHPCRKCTYETGRQVGCRPKCIRLLYYELTNKCSNKPNIRHNCNKAKELRLGEFRGHTFYPDGNVGCVNNNIKKYLKINYIRGIPHVSLCENGIDKTYRLDKAMYRAYNPWFNVDSNIELIHIDGNEKNCGIRNLRV